MDRSDGKQPAPFDDEDEYANRQEGDAIAAAIAHPEKFSTEHVFERVREEGLRHGDVVRLGGPWLLDSLRYSGDEARYASNGARWNCLKAMILQREDAVAPLAACLDLPHIKRSWFSGLFATMRFCSSEARARVLYAHMARDELFARLRSPVMADLPFLDVMASSALALAADEALEPAMAALQHRMRYLDDEYPHYSEMDVMLTSLPRIIASAGESGHRSIEALWNATKGNQEADSILGAALQMAHGGEASAVINPPTPGSTLELVADSGNAGQGVRRIFRLQARDSGSLLECETNNYCAEGLLMGDRIASEADGADASVHVRLIRAAQLEGFAPSSGKRRGRRGDP